MKKENFKSVKVYGMKYEHYEYLVSNAPIAKGDSFIRVFNEERDVYCSALPLPQIVEFCKTEERAKSLNKFDKDYLTFKPIASNNPHDHLPTYDNLKRIICDDSY